MAYPTRTQDHPVVAFSRGINELLGETSGRTVSRTTSQPIADAFGISHDTATDLVHAAMVLGLVWEPARKPVATALTSLYGFERLRNG